MKNKQKSIKLNIIMNVIRQIMSVIFPMITFPYVSRILGAEMYGRVNFSNSIIGYFSVIAALGISQYAVREGSRIRYNSKLFNKFCSQILSINVVTTIISYVFLTILIFSWNKLYTYIDIIFLQAITIILTTIGVDWIITIEEDYVYTTIRSILIQIISIIVLFVCVKDSSDYLLYVAISVFSSGANCIVNSIRSRKYVKYRFTLRMDIKKHLPPMIILFSCSLASLIYVNSDITMLGIYKGDYEVGIYSVATKIYNIVKQIISAMMIVCAPRLSFYLGISDKTNFYSLLNKMLNGIIIVALPAMTGLYSISSIIIKLIAGEEYLPAVEPLKILCIALIFALIAGFETSQILIPLKKDKPVLVTTVISAVINVLLNIALIPMAGCNAVALTTLLAELCVVVCSYYYVRKVYRPKIEKLTFAKSIIGCILISICCKKIQEMVNGDIKQLIISVVFCGIVYFIILRKELFRLILGKDERICQ